MALPDLSGSNISSTFNRILTVDKTGSIFDGTGSRQPISFDFDNNNLTVSGSVIAQTYVVSESVIDVSSGSTIFGNSSDDTHKFNGSITASGDISASGGITASAMYTDVLQLPEGGTIFFDDDGNTGNRITCNGNPEDIKIYTDRNLYLQPDSNVYILTSEGGGGNIAAFKGNAVGNHSMIMSGTITCSGDISSSGYLDAAGPLYLSGRSTVRKNSNTLEFGNNALWSKIQIGNSATTHQVPIYGNITASGNISASGEDHFIGGNITVGDAVDDDSFVTIYGKLKVIGSEVEIGGGTITASGEISASGGITCSTLISETGSFNHLITDGDTIEFRNSSTGAKEGTLNFDTTGGLAVKDAAGDFTKLKVDYVTAITSMVADGNLEITGPATASIISASDHFYGNLTNDATAGLTLAAKHDITLKAIDETVNFSNGLTTPIVFNLDATPKVDVLGTFELSSSLARNYFHGHIGIKGPDQNYVHTLGIGQGYRTSLWIPSSDCKTTAPIFEAFGSDFSLKPAKNLEVFHKFVIPHGYRIEGAMCITGLASESWTISAGRGLCNLTAVTESNSSAPCGGALDDEAGYVNIAQDLSAFASDLTGSEGNMCGVQTPVKSGRTFYGFYFVLGRM